MAAEVITVISHRPISKGWGGGFCAAWRHSCDGASCSIVVMAHGADARVRQEAFQGVQGIRGSQQGDEGGEGGAFAVFDGGDGAACQAAAQGDLFLAEIALQTFGAEALAEFNFNLGVGKKIQNGSRNLLKEALSA